MLASCPGERVSAMGKAVNIRGVPDDIHSWLDREKLRTGASKQELALAALRRAVDDNETPTLFDEIDTTPPSIAPDAVPFQFIDLFAGIGGLRLGLEHAGGKCVYSCEWNKYAQKTYHAWLSLIHI